MSPSNASVSSKDNLNPMKPSNADSNLIGPSGTKYKKFSDIKKPPLKHQSSIDKGSK